EGAQEAAVRRSLQLLAHDARERVDRLRGPRLADAELLQQRQPVGDQDAALRRRRVRVELFAAELGAHPPAPGEALLAQVSRCVKRPALARTWSTILAPSSPV